MSLADPVYLALVDDATLARVTREGVAGTSMPSFALGDQEIETIQRWISEGALNYVCARLQVAPAEAFGVASFYRMLSVTPRPRVVAHICEDLACRLKGSEDLCRLAEQHLGPPAQAHQPVLSSYVRYRQV